MNTTASPVMIRNLRLVGVVVLLCGLALRPAWIINHGVPASYADYAAGYVRGLWWAKWLLMAGGLAMASLASRLTRFLRRDAQVMPSVQTPVFSPLLDGGLMALLAAGGLILRLPGLGRSFTFDEVFIVRSLVMKSPIRMLFHPSGSSHLFDSLLAALSVRCLGVSEWSARLPALLLGVAAIPVVYLLGRSLRSRAAGTAAALALALNPMHIWYSQEAKGNAALMLGVLVAWLMMLLPLGRGKAARLLAYVASLLMAGSAHLAGITFLVAQACFLAVPWRGWPFAMPRRHAFMATVLALWMILLLYSPITPFLLHHSGTVTRQEGGAAVAPLVAALLREFTVLDGPVLSAFAMTILTAAGLFAFAPGCRIHLVMLMAPIVTGLSLVAAFGLFSFPRYHMYFLPALVVLAGMGAVACGDTLAERSAWKRRVSIVGRLLLLSAALGGCAASLSSYYRLPKSNLKAVAQWINTSAADRVYVAGASKAGYPASGLLFYTDRFETDATIGPVLQSLPADAQVYVVVIDAMALQASQPGLVKVLASSGAVVQRFESLGELDQYRIRESTIFRIDAGMLQGLQ